tara:strand:+ start:659 stop:859 length:201 start_codon:yes stop_codon:yes gene_type:complete
MLYLAMIFTFCRLAINRVVYLLQCVVYRLSETAKASSPLIQTEHDETEEKYRNHGNGKHKKTIDGL